jgi:hypothetical protein
MKSFLVLLSHGFEVVRFLFLLVGFPFRALLFLKFHPLHNANLGFCIDSLRVNDKPKMIAKRSVHDRVDFGRDTSRRPYFAEMDFTISGAVSPSVELRT